MTIHNVTRNGQTVSIDISKLSPEILDQLIRHGLTQKIGDAAAGSAKIAQETGMPQGDVALSLMQKVAESLLAGDWGVKRGESAGVSEETQVQRIVMRAALKEVWGAKSEKWKVFTGETDAKQAEILDALWTKNSEKLMPRFAAEMKKREIQRKAKSVSVEIDF